MSTSGSNSKSLFQFTAGIASCTGVAASSQLLLRLPFSPLLLMLLPLLPWYPWPLVQYVCDDGGGVGRHSKSTPVNQLLPAPLLRISDSAGTVMVIMPWVAGSSKSCVLLSRLQVRYKADLPVEPVLGGHTSVVVARALSSATARIAHVLVVERC